MTTEHDIRSSRSYNRFTVQKPHTERAMMPKPMRTDPIEVLLADSSQIQVQLLTSAMRRHPKFRLASCPLDVDLILAALQASSVDVVLLAAGNQGSSWQDMTLLRRLQVSFPRIPKVLLLESFDRDLVVNAFRSGTRGPFYFTASPFRSLCKCIQVVHRGPGMGVRRAD